jgi:hypothetical protein
MAAPSVLAQFSGDWTGINRLWLIPTAAPHESPAAASITLAARNQFLTIRYNWVYESETHDGLLVVGQSKNGSDITAFWIDSWHVQEQIMQCRGCLTEEGGISIKGGYSIPPEPDWGWQISVSPVDPGHWMMSMHNISPQGDETLAVEAYFERAHPTG